MQIFKFGGASVKDAEGVRNLCEIVKTFGDKETLVVVSAMGKTTNNLEELVKLRYADGNYQQKLTEINEFHRVIASDLLGSVPKSYETLERKLKEQVALLPELEQMKGYDQVIPFGELISTTLIQELLGQEVSSSWLDARTILRTDQYFTEANIDWVITERQVQQLVKPLMEKGVVITQGFIGSDADGNSTTLGREGSDFTGAVLAYCLNADDFTVWKDVPGILNADPRILSNTVQYQKLSYREVTEMTYYGAQVIHPKTLKPLAQKNIPLIVRSFLDHKKDGTTIGAEDTATKTPCFVFKGNQVLVTAEVKDHSFMEEKKLGLILQVLDLLNIKINLMQNSALTLSFCIDDKAFKLKRIKELLNRDFILSFESSLSLATIKNYTADSFEFLPVDRQVIMEQKTSANYQVLYRV